MISGDKELFNEKEKIIYAKCKKNDQNIFLNDINKLKLIEKKDDKMISKEAHTQNISFHCNVPNNFSKKTQLNR